MKNITVITGPFRSGTSCVTGLLERCGFDLGKNIRVLRDPTEHNPKGHFEHDLLFAINERLIIEAGQSDTGIFCVPTSDELALLAPKRERYFNLFIKKFDGELCKDPLLCITLSLWEQHWPDLRKAIFCLRHPLAVARSMNKRYGITIEQGLELWQTYTQRFFYSPRKTDIFIFDFDAFIHDPVPVFSHLLHWLNKVVDPTVVGQHIDSFVLEKYGRSVPAEDQCVPEPVENLYRDLKAAAGFVIRDS